MLDTEAADLARQHIQRDYGSLADLPEEFADTIANIYYRFYLEYMSSNEKPNALPQSIREGSDLFKDMTSYLKKSSRDLTFIEGGPELIESIRRLRDEKQIDEFEILVEVMLDHLKFGIDEAMNKRGIRRMIERLFKRRKVREIAGLATTLGLGNECRVNLLLVLSPIANVNFGHSSNPCMDQSTLKALCS